MNKIICLTLIVTLSCVGTVFAGINLAVVQSVRIAPYEKAVAGFQNICKHRIERFFLSDDNKEHIINTIKRSNPELIVAVGIDALLAVKNISDIPVVYLMVLRPEIIGNHHANISGVSMMIPHRKQLKKVIEVLPWVQNIGLLYDPSKSIQYMKSADQACSDIGLKLISRPVSRSQDVPTAITGLQGKMDIFWMIPDQTIVTSETVKYMLLFSIENKIPILTFSDKYVDMGAFMSLDIDPFDMGQQAGEMANKILEGQKKPEIKLVQARKAMLTTNMVVAHKMGILPKIATLEFENQKLFKQLYSIY